MELVGRLLDRPGPPCHQVATVNPEFVMNARRDPAVSRILEAADICLADGRGVEWAMRRQGHPLPERVPGVELAVALARHCAQAGHPVFLLGAGEGVAAEAAAQLSRRAPGLLIAGAHPGSPHPGDDQESLERIAAGGTRLLLVAYGHPHQELWIARNRERLAASVAIGVGGAFDYLSGRVRRAPVWMRRAGLEWLFRLGRQPWRARRMLVLPRFAFDVLRSARSRSI